jgi:NDP-sugar pyrophosphorylase family protein
MLAADLFTLPASLATFATHFRADAAPWDWLREIAPALAAQTFAEPMPPRPPGVQITGPVYLHPTVRLPHTATIIGPAWIGEGTEIRPGAFIRGHVIVGARCVLGNSCEFKNCLLLDGVQVPHFSYVGDSVLGNGAHLGAGAVLSNLRLDKKPVSLRLPEGTVDTGLKKFGALLADGAEVGCNAVLNPGTVLGKRALVMPTLAFGGYLPPATIAKARATVTLLPRRD